MFTNIKSKMDKPAVHKIIAYAAFDGSAEGTAKEVQKYSLDPNLHFYAWVENDDILGICGFQIHDDKIEIHLIAVDENARGRGVGGSMVTALQKEYNKDIEAETDDDAVNFYRKRGFVTHEFIHEKRGKRHTCILKKPQEPPKLWNREFTLLLAVNLINFIGLGIITPQIPRFAIGFGATLALAGFITGIFPFFALVGRPIASVLGDRLNKKRLLIATLFLNGFLTLLHAFVPGLYWMFPLRVIHGLAFSISGTFVIALGTNYIPRQRMAEGVGFLSLGNIIGMAIGPNIGIFLVDNFSFQLNFMISGMVIMAASLIMFTLRYSAPPQNATEKKGFRFGDMVAVELLPNAFFVAIVMMGTGLINSYMVILGYERGIANIGIYFITSAMVALFTRSMIGRIIDRRGIVFVILPGYIFAAAAMLLIGFANSLWMLLVAGALFAIGSGCVMPAIQSDCLRRLGRERGTLATGTYFIGLDLGMIAGPMLGGAVAGAFGFQVTFISAGFMMLLWFFMYLLRSRRG